jgi:tetratricopeptide (TPR) repeat protein
MPCGDENTVLDFIEGRLSADETRSFEEHIDGCADCRALVGAVGRAFAATGGTAGGGSPTPVHVGERVSRYVILDWVGAGGMGVVYSAYDTELDRKIALKLLRPGSTPDPEPAARLLREAKALAQVAHPNVVHVYDAGLHGELVFVAMEYVEGRTLGAWLRGDRSESGDRSDRRPWREVLAKFVDAGRGLAAVHAANLVHRDFKPSNVLLGRDGRVRITDFGLARALDAPSSARGAETEPEAQGITARTSLGTITATGAVHGTPAYMAPEQREGHATKQSDQFSFALSLYEALYGETPFESVGGELAYDRVRPARREKDGGVPARLRAVVLRALSLDPGARFESMDALLDALRVDAPRSWWRRAAFVVPLTVVIAVGGVAWVRFDRGRDRGAVCRGGEERLAGVWDADRRRSVHDALFATGSPLAQGAWTFAERGFDDYAKRWVSGYTDACEATRVRGEQSGEMLDRRMQCLDDRLAEMRSLTALLSHADAKMVGEAAQSPRGLGRIEDCANVRVLSAPLPPPGDPASAAEVERIRSSLAQSRALRDAGRYPESLGIATEAAGRARDLKYRPLEAEALFLQGEIEGRAKDAKTAESTLYAALAAAEAGHHDEYAARIWVKLLYLVGVRGARYEEAHRLDDMARASIERLGRADEIEAKRLDMVGLVLDGEGRHAEAIDDLQRADALLLAVYGHDDLDVALATQYLGEALRNAGRIDEATAKLQESEATLESVVGPEHPAVAGVLDDIGSLMRERGRYDDALAYHRRALGICETMVGPVSQDVAYAAGSLGQDLAALGRSDEALAAFQRSVAVGDQALGPEHPQVASALAGEGEAYLRLGRPHDAVTPLERALEIRRAHGASAADLAKLQAELERARRK